MKCNRWTIAWSALSLVVGLGQLACGQGGVSSASFSMARAGLPTDPNAVLIEEFVNYHRHDIQAAMGEAAALDLRWASAACGPGQREAVLQVGIAASRFRIASEHVPSLNLALVIDESGSMEGERIANVKKALLAFLGKLRPEDRVAIVGFSNDARVVLDSHSPPKQGLIREALADVVADGSTNLHAGLMLGYELVAAHYDADKTNRVILLTDGQANRGVTDSQQIIDQSEKFNVRDIDMSGIGVGSNFNHQLMRSLTNAGRGLLHFVADDADIEKTFVDELESLLSPVARRVSVEIEFEEPLQLIHVRGYQPSIDGRTVMVGLQDLNHGATQVILARFRAPAKHDPANFAAIARLKYRDVATGKQAYDERRVEIAYDPDLPADAPLLTDVSVRRNETIAAMAQGVKDLATAIASTNDPAKAATELKEPLKLVQKRYPDLKDAEVRRVYDILVKYDRLLDKEVERKEEFDRKRAAEKLNPVAK